MGTFLQERLAEAIIENKSLPKYKRKNKGQLLESIGYSKTTAKAIPTEIIESKGVKDALSAKGLTEDLIKNALVFDIENKPKRRERELRLGAEILGMTEHDRKGGDRTLIINITGETASRYGLLDAVNKGTGTDSN